MPAASVAGLERSLCHANRRKQRSAMHRDPDHGTGSAALDINLRDLREFDSMPAHDEQ
ncbi:hypothetical protein [Nostocoides australiense]